MRTGLLLAWVFIAILCLPGTCLAGEAFDQGKALFDAGNYPAAYAKLEEAFQAEPENLDISFYLGRAAFEAGDYEAAAMAFERVLIMEPAAPRVKLELARTYMLLGSHEVARQYFRLVQASNPPEAVWQNIEMMMASMNAAERKHFFNGFVTLGLFYDDNVGVFPKSDTIFINGLPFQLTTTRKEDYGMQLTGVINHVYRITDTPYVWKSSLFTFNNLYSDESDYNLNSLGLTTGPSRQTEDYLWDVQAQVARVQMDGERYFGLLGLGANYSRRFGQYTYVNFGVSIQDKNYYQNRNMDAFTWNVSVNPVVNFGDNRLSLAVAREDENAREDEFSYVRTSATLRYDRKLPYDLAAYGSFRYQKTSYEDPILLFGVERSDKLAIFEVGMSKTLWRSSDHRQSLSALVSHTVTKADSNISLYEYDKNLTLTSLTYAF